MSRPVPMPLGPVFLDVAGQSLTHEDRLRLLHPMAGGVIFFARNFASPEQIRELALEIRALREPRLLIAVDHEGGRVQRFRSGFTRIVPMAELGRRWEVDPAQACAAAGEIGALIGMELAASGVDFSFTPVLDLHYGPSAVIGDRAFHRLPEAVADLASALMRGLRRAGVAAVGKHFPGHGYAAEDSHVAIPVDERPLARIEADDIVPFRALIAQGLPAVMPAHVIYPRVDASPAGFSRVWLQEILRGRLGFQGAIFSDDLSMEGASVAGDALGRAQAALRAGCDMALVCNRPEAAEQILGGLHWQPSSEWQRRVRPLYASAPPVGLQALAAGAAWQAARAVADTLSG
ncbi:MAG: beta-N-acetylhexosaminidase [Burkholderiales bacterium]|nr:beta-N-acetylhexosaminidase [Burkholderiales bacterium]